MARRRRGKRVRFPRSSRPVPSFTPSGRPPRRTGAYLAGAAVIVVAYALLVPPLWAAKDYAADGPLSYTRPPLAPGDRLVPDGPTAEEVIEQERDELGTCSDDSELVVVGGTVGDRPYFAVYDVVGADVCEVTLRHGRTGADLDPDGTGGSAVTRVAKDGGAWPWLGPVNTPGELWLGLGAVLSGVLAGGLLSRRDIFGRTFGDDPGFGEWAYRIGLGLGALLLLVVNIDVLSWPDRLGTVVVLLLDASWVWGLGIGTWLLSPSLRDAPPAGGRPRLLPVLTAIPRAVGRFLRRLVPRRRRRAAGPATPATGVPVLGAPAPGRPAVPRFRVTPTSELPHYGNVGGMAGVKNQMEETVGLLLAFADEAEDYRITFNGILLHGPPGTGKTFLAKATAGEFGLAFVHVTAADLVSKYVGETARNVEAAFQTAAANVPSLLFLDEFDAVAARRDDDASAEDRRAVAQLLTSLERHRELRDLIVVAATNDLDRLDPAVVRAGRFDRHVRIDLPDAAGREAILRSCLRNRPTQQKPDLSEVVRRTEGCSAATLAAVVEAASLSAFREATTSGRRVRIGVEHLLAAIEARGGQDRPTVENWTWERLVLPEHVKAELKQVQALVEDPERARHYGVRPPSGMLLTGPPGTGKTTIARVLAAQARCSFYPVTVADLTSKWVGESEDMVARLFDRARENAPSIVFLDEIDAVAGRRSGTAGGFENRLVNQLLTEIDGLGGRGDVFVLAATNRPDVLDPALVRGGRLSRTLEIPLPDEPGRFALLRLHSSRMPLADDVDLALVAAVTGGWSGADLEALCQQAAVVAMTRAAGRGDPGARPRVAAEDFDAALRTMDAARHSAAAASMTRRDHVVPPPGTGGS